MTQVIDVSPLAVTNTPDSNRSVIGRMLSIVCSPDGQALYAGSYSNLWASSDGGQNFEQLTWPQPAPDQFDVPGSLGGWCVVDIAVALGWRVEKHPRFLARLTSSGHDDIVGFGDCGVWTALGNGDGSFQEPNVVIASLGYQAGGWRVDMHPRFVVDLTGDGCADIVGFGDAGVWTALGNGDGTFQEPKFVLAAFGNEAGNWQVDKHPRFLANLTSSGCADIVGFGDAGVWTARGNGDGTFQEPKFVLAAFGNEAGNWQVDKHPRFLANLTSSGCADIVGFGDAGVWTARGNGDGTFQDARYVLANFGVQQGWQADRHPRLVGNLTGTGQAGIVGFGDAGVWTALGDGQGGFPASNYVLANFGYGATVLALTSNDRATGSRGIWRSTDGGSSWTQVYPFPSGEPVGQLQWALGSDHLVYAAVGSALAISKNAGATFATVFPWGTGPAELVNHVAVWQNAPADLAPVVIYALGNSTMFLSFDGGATWMKDQAKPSTPILPGFPLNVGGPVGSTGNSNTPNVMVISPRFPLEVYVAQDGMGPGTSAMLYRADYSSFPFGNKTSIWEQLPLPETLTETTTQDAGHVFLATTQKGCGDLLFYGAQRNPAYVGPLYPASASDWRALAPVHADLHGILLSPDFAATINSGGDYRPGTGTVWILSDGGIYRSTNGGKTFQAAHNAQTLACIKVAGVAIPNNGPALSLNTGDNDGFYSMDGGQNWSYQQYGGGDNDGAFADPLRPHSMMVFTPRWDSAGDYAASTRDGQTVAVYETDPGQLPDGRAGTHDRRAVTGPPTLPDSVLPYRDIWNAGNPVPNSYVSRGSRPIVLGLPGEDAPAQGDYIFILNPTTGQPVLVRTQNILDIVHRVEWVTTATAPGQGANVYLQGPPLPQPNLGIVQASGGHTATVFYVGGSGIGGNRTLWTWTDGAANWNQIVPAPVMAGSVGANSAIRFFVSPYQPNLIYILDSDGVKRSDDGGITWNRDSSLETQLRWDKRIPLSSNDDSSGIGDRFDLVLTDMQFDPYNPPVRFAVGVGGAFATIDGVNWTRLVHTGALAGRPANCYYDRISNPDDPALYVAFAGRSLVKITGLGLTTIV